jgi:predicted HTH domain antitoxin
MTTQSAFPGLSASLLNGATTRRLPSAQATIQRSGVAATVSYNKDVVDLPTPTGRALAAPFFQTVVPDAETFGDHGLDHGPDNAREFVREYFEDHENERIEVAVALYEHERITLGDAVWLADVDRWTMRDILREHGVELRLGLADEDDAAYKAEAASELEFSDEGSNDEESPAK